MISAFAVTAAAELSPPIFPNPVFAGSRELGGADGDFIADGTLIEVKASIRSGCRREWVYQLLGYALLDYDDELGIARAGFYAARVPALIHWNLAELLSTLAGHTVVVAETRRAFRALTTQVRIEADERRRAMVERRRAIVEGRAP